MVFFQNSINAQQPSFPTAYGAGAYVTGGRGGQVIHVTNLNDKGPGSFREAITMTVPRIIVFDVSGIIDLKTLLYIDQKNGNVTIAGQTAPDGGITFTGERLFMMRVDNLVCRFVRFKGGIDADVKPNSGDKLGNDSVSGVASMTRQIFDHCTFGFGADEAASWYGTGDGDNVTDITIQRSLFVESIKGAIIGKQSGKTGTPPSVSFISNLFYNSKYRFPNVSGDNGRIDVINNVTWNSSARLIRANGSLKLNHIGNYNRFNYVPLNNNTLNLFAFGTIPKIYTANNKIVATNTNRNLTGTVTKINSDNKLSWRFFLNDGGYKTGDQLPNNYFTNSQYSLLGRSFSLLTAEQAFVDVSNNVGCNKRLNADGSVSNNLDKLDSNSLKNVNSGTYTDNLPKSKYIVDAIMNHKRDHGFYESNPHIPEIWFNANVPKGRTHNDIAPSGYTWIEEYLNQIDGSNEPIQVEEIEINPAEANLEMSKTLQLNVIFSPSDTSNQNGTWSSSNTKIATVDKSGLVTSISTGEVEIIFESADGEEAGTAEITVFKKSSEVSAGDDQQICKGTSTILTATGGSAYLWSTGAKTELITVAPLSTTLYSVIAYDDNGKKIKTAEVEVEVIPVPLIKISSDITINSGESVRLNAEGADTYLWNTGAKNSSITVSPNITTKYNVVGYKDGCEVTETVKVTVLESDGFRANAGEDREICSRTRITLTASGGVSYRWDTGETSASISVAPRETTVYTVRVYDRSGENSATDDVKVNVVDLSSLNIGSDLEISKGESVRLTATGASSYIWATGQKTPSILVKPNSSKRYTVTGSKDGCEARSTIKVNVVKQKKSTYSESSSDDIQLSKVLDVDVVNPNLDLHNDHKEFEFLVYPNPMLDEINIRILNLSGKSTLNLYDISGSLLYSEVISEDNHRVYDNKLNLSNFPSGVYLLRLVDNDSVITKKIILK